MIQCTPFWSELAESKDEVQRLQKQFDRQRYLHLPGLIERSTAYELQREIGSSEFYDRIHEGVRPRPPVDLCMKPNKLLSRLLFLANDPSFLAFIQNVTKCRRLGSFDGAVYSLVPGRGYDAWHDDVNGRRAIAMSINLSCGVYSGGALQLRERRSKRLLQEVANTGLGDAIIFRISRRLEHRVSRVEGVPRTAFAGWFQGGPDYSYFIKRAARRIRYRQPIR